MAMFYAIGKLLHAPLEDVLQKLYPATFLKWLYDVNLRQLAESCPETLRPPDRAQVSGADQTPKKAYLITLFLAVFQDKAMGRRFYETLPLETREVLAAATWERRVNLAALEKTLGRQIAELNHDERRSSVEPYLLPQEHGFLSIVNSEESHWGYYSWNNKPKKEDYCLALPDAIRKVFQASVPPPAGYELLPLATVPDSAGTLYSCPQKGIADLRLVAEYIAQGHLKYTKSERVSLSSLKALHQVTGGHEFFEPSDDSDLNLLRTRLLVGAMVSAGEQEREKLLAHPDSAEPARDLFAKVLANAAFLHEELLPHLPHNRNRWCRYDASYLKQLASFFAKLPADQWIAWENIRSYHMLREYRPTLFDRATGGLQAHAMKGSDAWTTSISIDERNEFELMAEPLLKGYAFLLAAFGMAAIAYRPPKQTAYHRPRKDYLTPYDGLRFVRLTFLGEFVFGRRKTLDVAGGPTIRAAITLDETRLLASCRNPDKLTELALGQLMEKLLPGRYRMTPKSLLGGCACREDIEERIRLFRRVVATSPPPIWEDFFARTLARIAPLNFEPEYVVLKVSADEEIRRLLASDPILREITLKVEGLRIAVLRGDLKKLAKRLEQFGYLSPIPT
jgi:hypothetical protein